MIFVTILVGLIGLAYVLYFISFAIGVRSIRKKDKSLSDKQTVGSISVIIPFRDEIDRLPGLIKSISGLDFTGLKTEFIFVNDHSTDGSYHWLREETKNAQCSFKLLDSHKSGKKAALSKGIESATYDIIVTTDADVFLPEKWLQTISRNFSGEIKMLVMPVGIVLNNLSFFQKFQALEVLALSCMGTGAVGINRPLTANGANLAFDKKAFYEVGGYNPEIDFPGGDDEFLLHRIHEKYLNGISAIHQATCLVKTFPVNSLKELIQQRKRWIAKSKFHRSGRYKLFTFIPGITMIVLFVLLILTPFSLFFFLNFCLLFGFKIFGDFFFFNQIVDLQSGLKKWSVYLIGIPFYQLTYMLGMIVLGRWHTFEWKKRSYGN